MLLNLLQELGYTTLMCGDGTNDVAALKHSHVGVALLSAMRPTIRSDQSKSISPTEQVWCMPVNNMKCTNLEKPKMVVASSR